MMKPSAPTSLPLLALLSCASILWACGDSDAPNPDAGMSVDAATGGNDAATGGNDAATGGNDAAPRADGGLADAGPTTVSCSDLGGLWRLTAWTCDGVPTDIESFGIEIALDFQNATTGIRSFRFYVPQNQTATWFIRSSGLNASFAGPTLTLTSTAPAEVCATQTGGTPAWGPVQAGTGEESCQEDFGAPGNPEIKTYDCVARGNSLMLSVTHGEDYGPCGAAELSVETWTHL